jgi:uncharacterized membrane protein
MYFKIKNNLKNNYYHAFKHTKAELATVFNYICFGCFGFSILALLSWNSLSMFFITYSVVFSFSSTFKLHKLDFKVFCFSLREKKH